MVNSIFKICQWQQWVATVSCLAIVCSIATEVSAQNRNLNEKYQIFAGQTTQRIARSNATPSRPQPFQPDFVDPPVPPSYRAESSLRPRTGDSAKYSALSRTFAEGKRSTTARSGRLQDIFGENPQGDIFNEQGASQDDNAPIPNPFQKVDPDSNSAPGALNQDPNNPFGEITPPTSQAPKQSPFNELPSDPNPITPPMDTRPIQQPENNQVEPNMPIGSQFAPDPSRINPTPPIPGEADTPIPTQPQRPVDDDNEVVTPPDDNQEDPGGISDSIFDSPPGNEDSDAPDLKNQDDIEDEDDDSYIPPVPAPASSRVYLPARTPTEYATPNGSGTGNGAGSGTRTPPPGYDPRSNAANPYAGLPGPYGYPAQAPYPGYVPPGGYAAPYGQQAASGCGPGCIPTQFCGTAATPALAASNFAGLAGLAALGNRCGGGCGGNCGGNCGGCNSGCGVGCAGGCNSGCCGGGCNSSCGGGCNSSCGGGCNSNCGGECRPALATRDIGERIVETSELESISSESYVDVVSECDEVCANYASCYVGVFGGWSDLNNFTTVGEVGTGDFFEDSGFLFGVTVGQIQGRNLRTELELSYRNIDVNGLQLQNGAASQFVGLGGDFGAFAGMFNGYWEFVDFGPERIKPYIGGGIGFALARPDLIQTDGTEAVIDNNESSFAWQWMAGLNYKASPTLDAFVEYRYFTADSFRLDTEIPNVPGLGNGSGPFDFNNRSVLFGLRARF